jgi:hypothetical protein
MYTKPDVGGIDLNRALNDLIQAGIRDPNILLKYSQNPPPEYGANGSMLVSLAANAVARDKEASKTLQPSPNKTIAEQVQTKLASAAQPQGIAGLAPQAPTAPQGINTSPPPQNMDGGIAPLPIDDTMYSDQNYAGGGIVSFAAGKSVTAPKDYKYDYNYESYYDDPKASLMAVPTIPTADDLKMETQALKSNFVDPTYYASQEKTLKDQTLEDVAESKKMSQSDILFRLAKGFQTPGSFLKGAAAAGVEAGPAVSEMNKNIIDAKRLNRDAINKLNQAKYAESIGDFKTAMELRESAKTKAAEAQKTNATLDTQINIAGAKAKAANAGKTGDLNAKIYDKAQKDFASSFPNGAQETVFQNNPGFFQFVKNQYLQNAQDYISSGTMPSIPTASQLKDMYDNRLTTKPPVSVKPVSKLSGKDSPLASTRPKNIQSILDKYPKTGSRSTNTQEELDVPWDLAGQGLED